MDRKLTGIRARGNSIILDFMYQGQRCRETLRTKPTKSAIKEAARKREAILYDIAMERFEYSQHFPHSKHSLKYSNNKSSLITIKDTLEKWLSVAAKRCQHSTMRDYNSAVYHHLIPTFGKLSLDQFNVSHVYEWLDEILISQKRINNVLSPLRQALQEAFYDDLIDKNPMDRFRHQAAKQREPSPFNQSEISKILFQLSGQARNLIQFAFFSGLRTSELIALRWEDVDLDNNSIHVRIAIVRGIEKTTKTMSGQRTIELLPEGRCAIVQQLMICPHSHRVFNDPTTSAQWLGDHIIRKRIWMPALKAAGVKYRNPYQTRHTYASMLLSNGENPLKVAQQMGHKDWGMIRKTYGRWIQE